MAPLFSQRSVLIVASWALCIFWYTRDQQAARESALGDAAASWRGRHAKAPFIPRVRASPPPPAAPARGSGSAALPLPPPPPSSRDVAEADTADDASPEFVYPAGRDGLQLHGLDGRAPGWPLRTLPCPVPIVTKEGDPERFKRISGLYRNISTTLVHSVHVVAARRSLSGDATDALPSNSAALLPHVMALPDIRVASQEVNRFVGMQEDLIARFGVAMEVSSRFDVRIMSPAIVHTGGGRFLLFARVSCYPAEIYDNMLWTQELDEALEPVAGTGAMVGIPNHSEHLMAPGPEDPRAIVMNGEVLVIFNHQFRNDDRRMLLYNHAQRRLSLLSLVGVTQQRAEKNWMPFVHDDALHLIYQMSPLIIVRCTLPSGECVCVQPAGGCTGVKGIAKGVATRGGTPLTRVGEHLFVGLLHTTYRHHMIRSHIAFLSTAPWGWVALSGPLPMPEALPGCYEGQVPWDVQFPAAALLLGPRADALLLGIHVRDAMGSIVHVDMDALPDQIARTTAAACEELYEGGELLRAPSADSAAVGVGESGEVGGDAPYFDATPWLTSTGESVPSCKRWAIIPDANLDALLVPMLH